jgi:hypothetical protein
MIKSTDTGLFLFLTVILLTVSVFGGHFAYTVNGVPAATGSISSQSPGVFGFIGWIWDSVKFFFGMMFFQVPGMPAIMSVIWLGFLVFYGWIIFKAVRGSSISP